MNISINRKCLSTKKHYKLTIEHLRDDKEVISKELLSQVDEIDKFDF